MFIVFIPAKHGLIISHKSRTETSKNTQSIKH